MRISELINDSKDLRLVYKTSSGDFVVNLKYRPQVVTLRFLRELRDLEGEERVLYQIEKAIVSWDLQDENDKVIPVSKEAIEAEGIPVFLLSSILNAVASDRGLEDEAKNG